MNIKLIWAKDDDDDSFWVFDAWDEHTIDNNPKGFHRKLKEAESEADNVLVQVISVSDDDVSHLFNDTNECTVVNVECS